MKIEASIGIPAERKALPKRLAVGTVALLMVSVACGASSPPDPADVQAAKACQALYDYLDRKVTGPEVLNAVVPLLPTASASAQSSPKWAGLGHDILAATSAAFNGDATKLKTLGDKATGESATIPPRAKAVVGFKH